MTSLMFGVMGNTGIPVDEKVVRSTATPVDAGAPAAVQNEAPEFNEPPETDENPNLGMVNRTLASHWVEGEQYAPFWQGQVSDQWTHNALIDKQVSTSGTAAAREASGVFGHGTAKYAIGIEPTQDLREGGSFGNEFFDVGKPEIQRTMDAQMSVPPGYDSSTSAQVAAAGKSGARAANQGGSSPYDQWWREGK